MELRKFKTRNFSVAVRHLSIGIFLLSASSLQAQELNFGDFDKDGDGWVEKKEFKDEFAKNYVDDWDNTDNSGLDDEDFYTFNYNLLDADDDDLLSDEEWDYGYDYYYGDYLEDDFDVYDTDADNYLSYSEYYDALYDTDYFLEWDIDKDTYLSQDELAEQVFDTWETDESGMMSESEFNNFEEFYEDV